MKDKLDVFLDLLGEKNNYGNDKFEELLFIASNNPKAFLFLYESMPEHYRPDIKKCSDYHKELFVNIIAKQDEETFNHYFFSGLHEELNIEQVRDLHFQLPENKKLKQYVIDRDNPKNIDEIIILLSQLWENNSDQYPIMFEKYLPKLEKISEIKSQKSRAASNFSWWGQDIIEEKGLKSFFEFCNSLNYLSLNGEDSCFVGNSPRFLS